MDFLITLEFKMSGLLERLFFSPVQMTITTKCSCRLYSHLSGTDNYFFNGIKEL